MSKQRRLCIPTAMVLLSSFFAVQASVLQSSWAVSPQRPVAYHEVVDATRRTIVKSSDIKFLQGMGSMDCFPGGRRRDFEQDISEVQLVNRVKMWPPWPLSLLQGGDNGGSKSSKDRTGQREDEVVTARNTYPSAAAIALAWCTQRARIGVRQLQEAGSTLWFHLPPIMPPLLAAACMPRRVEAGRIIPLFKDPFARNLVLGGLGIAVLSWAHQELHRKQKLTPLVGVPVSQMFLPPFLPELVPEPEIEALQQSNIKESDDHDEEDSSQLLSMLSPRFRKHLSDFYESSPLKKDNPLQRRSLFKEWKRTRDIQKRESAKVRRQTIFDELVALRAIKRNSKARRSRGANTSSDERGYALVTGASQGIGRALAVELARWEIPLILVARDLDRLTSLAYDLEACYGVRCCVLQADLSQGDAAERIYETAKDAGLTVDILVNNAGIAYEGMATDMDTSLMERMIMINTMSFAKLAKLFGDDMKKRRRGRMLMVSSMAGMTSASPNTALYGATKSFEKSLSFSMSKELESFGVGVTCLMPGPVTDTQFRSRSGTSRALCWYIPFYPRPAETVAHQGVKSLLDGDTQVIPGWQNRAFVQLFRPLLPQRVETMCVEAAWSPLRLPSFKIFGSTTESTAESPPQDESSGLIDTTPPDSIHLDLKPRYNFQMPPRLLKLPVQEIEPEIPTEPSVQPFQEESETCRAPTAAPSPAKSAADFSVGSCNSTQDQLPTYPSQQNDKPMDGQTSLNANTGATEENEKVKTEGSLSYQTRRILDNEKDGDDLPIDRSESISAPSKLTRDSVQPIEQSSSEKEADYQGHSDNPETSSPKPVQAIKTRLQHPQTKNYDEDDTMSNNRDDMMSPRLGPIDLLRDCSPFTTLPKSSRGNGRVWTVEV